MRVEPYGVNSILHIIKRGARGMNIVRDQSDRWRFVRGLYVSNDLFQPPSRTALYKSDLYKNKGLFHRPEEWPKRRPLTSVLAWVLMDNHFHLLVKEHKEGGTAKFMQRFCGSMTLAFNTKYKEVGSLFQGSYKSRTVKTNEYLRYVHAYVVVKNVLENYPGGLRAAMRKFEAAWEWALHRYPFSSLQTSVEGISSQIVDVELFCDLGLLEKDFKQYARTMLTVHAKTRMDRDDLKGLQLESW